jgi:hypothetical protein
MLEQWRAEIASWGVLRTALLAAVIGIAIWYVALGATRQWDFETYYYAAAAYRLSLDPYDVQSLTTVAGHPIDLPYLYAPVALLGFIPLTYLPITVASALWLGFKCVLVIALLRIWWKVFLRSTSLPVIVVVTVLGFNLALLWDLRTGNAALVEEVLLWLAFAAFVHGKRLAAVCLIAVASVFKLYPILFLGIVLPPLGTGRGSPGLFALGLLLFVGLIAFPVPGAEGWGAALASSLGGDRPPLAVNGSALGIADAVLRALSTPSSVVAWLGPLLYAAYCIPVAYLSGPLFFRAVQSGSAEKLVAAAVLVWMLIAPRVMVYSYVMAVVPALSTISSRVQSSTGKSLAVGLLLAPGVIRLVPGEPPVALSVVTFLLLLWLWVVASSSERREGH